MSLRFIHVITCIRISFLFKAEYTRFCLSIEGHLSFFSFMTIVNNAAMIQMYKYLFESLLSILSGIYPEVELLDHTVMVILCLIFRVTVILFSIAAAAFYVSTSNAEMFQFLHNLANTHYVLFF